MKFRSILLAEARGSVAGATFSRNGNSAYVRARATPVNPRSSSQTVSRDRLNAVSTAWRSLTQGERNTWIALAPTIPYVNSLGETSTYSGFQLFMKCNLTVLNLGNPIIGSAPAGAPTFPAVGIAGLLAEQDSVTFGDFSLATSYLGNPSASGMQLQFEATYPMSAGKKFIAKSSYKPLGAVDAVAPQNPWILTTPYEAAFGIPNVSFIGSRIGMRFRFVDLASGLTSPWLELSVIVTEA